MGLCANDVDFGRRVSLLDCLSYRYAGDPVADDYVPHSLHLFEHVFRYTTLGANPIVRQFLKGHVVVLSRVVHVPAR